MVVNGGYLAEHLLSDVTQVRDYTIFNWCKFSDGQELETKLLGLRPSQLSPESLGCLVRC